MSGLVPSSGFSSTGASTLDFCSFLLLLLLPAVVARSEALAEAPPAEVFFYE